MVNYRCRLLAWYMIPMLVLLATATVPTAVLLVETPYCQPETNGVRTDSLLYLWIYGYGILTITWLGCYLVHRTRPSITLTSVVKFIVVLTLLISSAVTGYGIVCLATNFASCRESLQMIWILVGTICILPLSIVVTLVSRRNILRFESQQDAELTSLLGQLDPTSPARSDYGQRDYFV